jgi:hypothetical protein
MDRAKDLCLSLAKQETGTLMCGEEKVLQATVNRKGGGLSRFDSVTLMRPVPPTHLSRQKPRIVLCTITSVQNNL